MKITKNYHSHTVFCKHASETIEEVVKEAIKYGFEEFGFSSHTPLPYGEKNSRISNIHEMESYFKEVKRMQIKYKSQIKILAGLEVDIINPNRPEESTESGYKMIEKYDELDYVIVGHHKMPDTLLKSDGLEYIEKLEEFINYSTKFKYLAHPDIIMTKLKNHKELGNGVSRRIISLSIKYDFPLGINIIGIYENKDYPSEEFFKLANEMNAETIFEMDNHYKEIGSTSTFEKAFSFARKTNSNPINGQKK